MLELIRMFGRDLNVNAKNGKGNTAFMIACARGSTDVALEFIRVYGRDLDVNAKKKTETPRS